MPLQLKTLSPSLSQFCMNIQMWKICCCSCSLREQQSPPKASARLAAQSPLYAATAKKKLNLYFPHLCTPWPCSIRCFRSCNPSGRSSLKDWVKTRSAWDSLSALKRELHVSNPSPAMCASSVPALHKHSSLSDIFLQSQPRACRARPCLIKLARTPPPFLGFFLGRWRTQTSPGCTWALQAHVRSLSIALCFVLPPVIQLTSAALEIQYYHIIYEGWPSGMQLK